MAEGSGDAAACPSRGWQLVPEPDLPLLPTVTIGGVEL